MNVSYFILKLKGLHKIVRKITSIPRENINEFNHIETTKVTKTSTIEICEGPCISKQILIRLNTITTRNQSFNVTSKIKHYIKTLKIVLFTAIYRQVALIQLPWNNNQY